MGRELFPVVTALRQWGADYLFDDSEPRACLADRRTGIPAARVGVQSADVEPLAPEDTQTVVRGPGGVGD